MKKVRHENHRVVITLNPSYMSHDRQLRRGNELLEQIQRHCDVDVGRGFGGIGRDDIAVDWDSVEYCGHCGFTWETDDAGRPQCCEAAQVEWVAAELEGQHG